jgi:hypothetical protein
MNYLELINNFWQKDSEYGFTEKEIAFFFYLLKTCNSQGWRNPFGLSNAITTAKFCWNRHTLNDAKNKLKQAGLIRFEAGRGRGNIYRYELLHLNNSSEHKLDKTNQLALPFSSSKFQGRWEQLLKTPKWTKKSANTLQATLNKLAEYEEEFAIQLIEQCILGNWQGIIFNDTNIHYQKWKDGNKRPDQSAPISTGDKRKTEIIHRATLASISCNS